MMVHHPLFEMLPTFPEVALVRMQWGSEYKKEHRTDRELFLNSEKFELEDIFLLGCFQFDELSHASCPILLCTSFKAFPGAFVQGLHILFNAHIMLPTRVIIALAKMLGACKMDRTCYSLSSCLLCKTSMKQDKSKSTVACMIHFASTQHF